jgi:phosphonate transport system permease protein
MAQAIMKPQHSPEISVKSLILDSVLIGSLLLGLVELIKDPTREQLIENFSLVIWIALACFIAAGALTYSLNKANIKTLGITVFEPQHKKNIAGTWYKTFWGLEFIVWFVASMYAGGIVTTFSLHELFSQEGFEGARRIFSSLAHPEMSIFPQAVLAIIETIFIAFMATVIAIPFAFVLSFFSAKNLMRKSKTGLVVYFILRSIQNLTRSIEPLIWAIIFSVWVGIGPFAGMLALMLHSVASLTKQYSEMIESIAEGPIEGIESTGASPIQVIWFAVVPQIILPYIAFTIYRWDINVRMATIIGLVGGGGIGTMLIQYQGQAMWREVGCLVVVIAAVVWLMDTASAYIREAIQ